MTQPDPNNQMSKMSNIAHRAAGLMGNSMSTMAIELASTQEAFFDLQQKSEEKEKSLQQQVDDLTAELEALRGEGGSDGRGPIEGEVISSED